MTTRDDDAIMARFVRDYLALLDDRVQTIETELGSGNDMTAHVALLSLESTSAMIGEKELAKIVGVMRTAVEKGQHGSLPALLATMTAEAKRVRDRLERVP